MGMVQLFNPKEVEVRGITRIFAVVLALIVLASSPSFAGFGVRAYGGMDYIRYSDYNDFVDYINGVVLSGLGVSSEINNIHFVPEIGGEVLFSTLPWFTVGVGAGMIYGKSSLEVEISGDVMSFEHKIKAYPITGTLYFKPTIPLFIAKPYFFAGAGMYYCKMNFNQMLTYSGITEGFDSELTKSGFGFHGGAGIEFSLVPMVSISLEVKGRMAKIKGFEGTATSLDGEKKDVFVAKYSDEYGNLIYGPEDVADKDQYEEGTLDLSGFGALVAVKIFF